MKRTYSSFISKQGQLLLFTRKCFLTVDYLHLLHYINVSVVRRVGRRGTLLSVSVPCSHVRFIESLSNNPLPYDGATVS